MRKAASRRVDGSLRSGARWRMLDLGRCAPLRAMAFADAVARSVGRGEAPNTLIFARPSSPFISVGFHQSADQEVDDAFARRRRLSVLRRVEGGGTVYLDRDQLFYQFIYADGEDGSGGPADFARYLGTVVGALRSLGLPAELRPPSDIVVGGRKVSGNAGGEWENAHILTGDLLGRVDRASMAGTLRLPHPGLRPLVRRELTRWMTSWAEVAGHSPTWGRIQSAIISTFESRGLGHLAPGHPTKEEERVFRSDTLARHGSSSWRETPPVGSASGQPLRKIRIAGPHHVVVFEDPVEPGYLVAVTDGGELVEGYRIGPGPRERLHRLPSRTERARALPAALMPRVEA